jgi:hypothetical protein
MYENFVIATQSEIFLFLEKAAETVHGIRFDGKTCKYGSPNDEVRHGHPLAKHGLGFYGLYRVENSPWIREMMEFNRIHPRHKDNLFWGLKHYVACFKDVMLGVACRQMTEVSLSVGDLSAIVAQQISYLESSA